MHNYIIKKYKNQHSESKFLNRIIRRSRWFRKLTRQGIDPALIYNYFESKKRLGKRVMYEMMNLILILASKGLYTFPSVAWLAHYCNCTESHVKKITAMLAEQGFIRKWYQGMRHSVVLLLNPLFNNPVIVIALFPLFPFMKTSPVFMQTSSQSYFVTDDTYNKFKNRRLKVGDEGGPERGTLSHELRENVSCSTKIELLCPQYSINIQKGESLEMDYKPQVCLEIEEDEMYRDPAAYAELEAEMKADSEFDERKVVQPKVVRPVVVKPKIADPNRVETLGEYFKRMGLMND